MSSDKSGSSSTPDKKKSSEPPVALPENYETSGLKYNITSQTKELHIEIELGPGPKKLRNPLYVEHLQLRLNINRHSVILIVLPLTRTRGGNADDSGKFGPAVSLADDEQALTNPFFDAQPSHSPPAIAGRFDRVSISPCVVVSPSSFGGLKP